MVGRAQAERPGHRGRAGIDLTLTFLRQKRAQGPATPPCHGPARVAGQTGRPGRAKAVTTNQGTDRGPIESTE